MASRQDVADFLSEFKTTMEYGEYHLVRREKNIQDIEDLGLTLLQAKAIITGLRPEDYSSGPEPDDADPTKEVWTFGHDLEETEIYIKLRLAPVKGKKHVQLAKVLSFHKAEYPLEYPLREGKR